MKVTSFIWLDEIVDKLAWKHGVDIYEVEEIFLNRPRVRFAENGKRRGENVYLVMGQTDGGRYLICFYILKPRSRALILSARDMTTRERKLYERK